MMKQTTTNTKYFKVRGPIRSPMAVGQGYGQGSTLSPEGGSGIRVGGRGCGTAIRGGSATGVT